MNSKHTSLSQMNSKLMSSHAANIGLKDKASTCKAKDSTTRRTQFVKGKPIVAQLGVVHSSLSVVGAFLVNPLLVILNSPFA